MAETWDELIAELTPLTNARVAFVTLFDDLQARYDAAIATGNINKIREVSAAIKGETAALIDAALARTPAAPTA